jgi:hypothetical protein
MSSVVLLSLHHPLESGIQLHGDQSHVLNLLFFLPLPHSFFLLGSGYVDRDQLFISSGTGIPSDSPAASSGGVDVWRHGCEEGGTNYHK